MDDNQEWLDSLKEGDMVALRIFTYSNFKYRIAKITRITPTRIIKVDGYEFNKNGKQRGRSTWGYNIYLEPITQDILDEVEKEKLFRRLNNIKFQELSLDKLRKISDVVDSE